MVGMQFLQKCFVAISYSQKVSISHHWNARSENRGRWLN